ncbi:MAG TPA: glycosyltransferase family A protein [Solirubrobacteraceae bacterium]|nr:glycosyltransferase family A protein [Solirubrobacteraceae bacterium]
MLLPTRNRLEYLKLAVESVLRQDVQDWQLVISDNDSEQDIAGYVASLDDRRIVYGRTERLLAVTENWNRALSMSDGEYVIMLGDDDALLDGYLRRMQELIARFEQPDVIYTKALLFTYPGVDPARPSGWLMDHGCGEFFAGASEPFVLGHTRALELVRGAMGFRLRYDFNAQFALISRRVIDSLLSYGDFYQSDFPDYYSMNAAFLRAERIVVDPSPRVVIGVTPKSYGYFHVNDKENEGRAFLGGAAPTAATGTNINVGWLSAMSALERGIGGDFGLTVDRRRYRFVQAAYVYARYRAGVSRDGEMERLEQELPPLERWSYRAANAALGIVDRFVPARRRTAMLGLFNRLVGQLPPIDPAIVEGRYADVLEVCAATAPSPSAGAAQAAGK